MTKTVEQWSRQANNVSVEFRTVERRAAARSALHVKTSVLGTMAAAVGSDLRMSGVGKRGAKIGVRYTVKGSAVLVRATGPAALIEGGARPHRIPKDTASGRKKVVVIPGVGVRRSANHPGMKGKRPWQKGVAASRGQVPAIFADELHQGLKRAFHL